PDSRILVFPVQYSRNKSAWLNYWAAVDGPGSERTDISRFHMIPEGAVYQTSCAPCHTSQLKANPKGRAATHAADFSFAESGINCEMCHGPSKSPIDRIRPAAVAPRAP